MARGTLALSRCRVWTVVLVAGLLLPSVWAAATAPPVASAQPAGASLPRAGESVPGVETAPSASLPNPYSNGMAATLAVGQPNLASRLPGGGPRNLSFPSTAAAFDASGDLWVADTTNNRVLEYLPPFATGMSATIALGQTSLSGTQSNVTQNGLWEPAGLAFGSGARCGSRTRPTTVSSNFSLPSKRG